MFQTFTLSFFIFINSLIITTQHLYILMGVKVYNHFRNGKVWFKHEEDGFLYTLALGELLSFVFIVEGKNHYLF